jgi:hypothetical protein
MRVSVTEDKGPISQITKTRLRNQGRVLTISATRISHVPGGCYKDP